MVLDIRDELAPPLCHTVLAHDSIHVDGGELIIGYASMPDGGAGRVNITPATQRRLRAAAWAP